MRHISGYDCGRFPKGITWGCTTYPEYRQCYLRTWGLDGRKEGKEKALKHHHVLSLLLVLHEEASLLEASTAMMFGPRNMEASDP